MENDIASLNKRLEDLGLSSAAKKVSRSQKMLVAYSKYLYISEDKVDKFNEKLKAETIQEDKRAIRFKRLDFIPLDKYSEVPPDHVLDRLQKAKEDNCFDSFEVTKIGWIEQIKDPILFGRIEGCTDRFYIAQWDDDINIGDLLFEEK